MKVITSTHYNRPDCSLQMIQHLEQCSGINDYLVVFCVEPGNEEVIKVIRASSLNRFVVVNDRLLGCWTNKKRAVAFGFELSDFVIHIEDDVIVAKDTLEYFEWAKKIYESNPAVFTITGFNSVKPEVLDLIRCPHCHTGLYSHQVGTRKYYTSVCWGMWKNRWTELTDWSGRDHDLCRQYRGERVEVYPFLSRANHIGFVQGNKSPDNLGEEIKLTGNDYTIQDGIAVNPEGREWVKMCDGNVRSRESSQFYKDRYFLENWAGSVNIENETFFDWGYVQK